MKTVGMMKMGEQDFTQVPINELEIAVKADLSKPPHQTKVGVGTMDGRQYYAYDGKTFSKPDLEATIGGIAFRVANELGLTLERKSDLREGMFGEKEIGQYWFYLVKKAST